MSNEDERAFRAWRAANESELASIGVPLAIYSDRAVWNYFVLHGEVAEWPGMPSFRLDELDGAALARLYTCLVRDAPSSIARLRAARLMFPRLRDVRAADALVRAAIIDPSVFKEALMALETLEPDEAAARIVVDAHDRREIAAWLAVALLGRIRHRAGYEKVVEILRSNDPQANSWAGEAAVRIVGAQAEGELMRLIEESEHGLARKAAARTLGRLGTESAIAFLVAALESGRLRERSVAESLCAAPVDVEVLVRSLASPLPQVRRWVPMMIAFRLRDTSSVEARGELARCAASLELRRRLATVLADDDWTVWDADRKAVEAWLASLR